MAGLDTLRANLNERIPLGLQDTDTNFSDEELQMLLDDSGQNMRIASYEGWMRKAAIYADLVDTAEGISTRKFSDLHAHALQQAKLWDGLDPKVNGRTRIGRIVSGR